MRSSITIATKLGLSLAALVLLIVATYVLALAELRSVNTTAAEMRDVRLPATDTLGRIGILVMQLRVNGGRLITADTDELRTAVKAKIDKREQQLAENYARFESLPLTQPERDSFASLRRHMATYDAEQARAMAMVTAGDGPGGLHHFNAAMSDRINDVLTDWDRLVELNAAGSKASGVELEESYERANLSMLSLAALALVVAAGATVLVMRGVSRPLKAITRATQRLAGGDTEGEIPEQQRSDEIGQLAGAVVIFRDSLIRTRTLEAASAQAQIDSERRATTAAMADAFEQTVGTIVGGVSTAAGGL